MIKISTLSFCIGSGHIGRPDSDHQPRDVEMLRHDDVPEGQVRRRLLSQFGPSDTNRRPNSLSPSCRYGTVLYWCVAYSTVHPLIEPRWFYILFRRVRPPATICGGGGSIRGNTVVDGPLLKMAAGRFRGDNYTENYK